MRFQSKTSFLLSLASRGLSVHALFRWLLVLLMVFDQVSAPWHGHHHGSGVDGLAASAAVQSVALQSAVQVQTTDDPSLWAHATTMLRIEADLSLTDADDFDGLPAAVAGLDRLTTEARALIGRMDVSQVEPRTPADLRLPHAPQAPPLRA